MRFTFFLLILYFISNPLFGATTFVCENPEYKNTKLDFYKNADPVTGEAELLFSLNFDSSGKSSKTLETAETVFAFCDFGVYRGMLFIEPGQTIQLLLPPKREKSFADQKNPYFEPFSFWFATADKNQLNNIVSDFTLKLNQLTDKYFNQLYFRQSKAIFDSLNYIINRDFGKIKPETFQFHKTMKLKMVETEAFRAKPETYSEMFNEINPAFWLHPSFVELFQKTFGGQLSFEAKSLKGNEIKKAVNSGDFSFLYNHLKSKFKITGEMADLVLLKMLHDAFYTRDFSTDAIQKMVENTRFSKNKNSITQNTALNIAEKLRHLQPGKPAPVICLKSLDGDNICTNINRGKYKYLVFADVEMVICREQLKNIGVLQKKFEKNLEVFVVFRQTNGQKLKKYISENQIGGIQLLDVDNKFTEEYRIKSFPQSFLLDPDHNVKLANAKNPLDAFDLQFMAVLRQQQQMKK